MRYALIIALGLLACRRTEDRERPTTETTAPSEGIVPRANATPETGGSREGNPPAAARTTTAPQRGPTTGEAARPDSPLAAPVVMSLAQAKWMAGPPGLPKGAQLSVLEGQPPFDTAKSFTVLLKFPKNYTIAPHMHLVTERVTVLQGALSFGHGEKLDRARATKVPPGGFVLMPAGHVHFAFTTDQETTVALTGVGPWEIIYVNPKDDPRPTPARMPERRVPSMWDASVGFKIVQPNDVTFTAAPAGMFSSDVKVAVLEGDPTQPKTFTMRVQLPKGAREPVHSHPHTLRFFVLAGSEKFGIADTWDESKLQQLTAPAAVLVPANTNHFARSDEGDIVQIFGVGPYETKLAR